MYTDILLGNTEIVFKILNVQTPPSERNETTFTLKIAVENGDLIDTSNDFVMNNITVGMLSKNIEWTSKIATPAIESSHNLSFITNGGVVANSKIQFYLVNNSWEMNSVPTISFLKPSTVQTFSAKWNSQ